MAGSRTYRSRCIVLDKTRLKETDLILTLLAEDGRRIRAVAKGARKPGSRLAARSEVCSTVDLLLAHGRTLDIVSQAELLAAPLGAAPSLERLSAASAVLEVAALGCFEDAPDPFIFPLTERALQILGEVGEGPALDATVAAYVFKLLSHIGYRPDLSACVSCGDEAAVFFSASAGGLICGSCAKSMAGAEEIGANGALWLQALIGMRFDKLARAPIDRQTAALLLALAHVWAATHLDARLRALEFLLGR